MLATQPLVCIFNRIPITTMSNTTANNYSLMNTNSMDAISKITDAKGQFVSVSFRSTKTPAKAFKGTVLEKVTAGTFRAGINFANLSSVKEGIATGERGEVQSLPWGNWVKFPYLIENKGETYIRLYPTNGCKVSSTFFVNGKEVSKEEFNSFLTPSDAKPSDKPLECFTIKATNLISVS